MAQWQLDDWQIGNQTELVRIRSFPSCLGHLIYLHAQVCSFVSNVLCYIFNTIHSTEGQPVKRSVRHAQQGPCTLAWGRWKGRTRGFVTSSRAFFFLGLCFLESRHAYRACFNDWAENLLIHIDFLRTLCGQIISYFSEMQKMGVSDYVFEIQREEWKNVFFFPGFYRVELTKGNLACQIYIVF